MTCCHLSRANYTRVISTTARLACARFVQGFAPLLHNKVNEHKRGQRVGPPQAKEGVEQEADQQCEGHIGAGYAAYGVRFEGGAAYTPGYAQFALPEQGHDDGGGDG